MEAKGIKEVCAAVVVMCGGDDGNDDGGAHATDDLPFQLGGNAASNKIRKFVGPSCTMFKSANTPGSKSVSRIVAASRPGHKDDREEEVEVFGTSLE